MTIAVDMGRKANKQTNKHSNTTDGSQPYQESNGEHNFPPIQTSFVEESVSDQMQLLGTVAWLIEVLLGVKKVHCVLGSILVSGTFFSEDLAMKTFLWLFSEFSSSSADPRRAVNC